MFPLVVNAIGFTFVTVPPVPVAERVIVPFPLSMVNPVPALKVPGVKVFPFEFPINN